MKYANIVAFNRYLEKVAFDSLSHVYLLNGKEESEKEFSLKILLSALLKGEDPSLIVNHFDCSLRGSIGDMLDNLHAVPFFGGRSIVVLHNTDKLEKKSLNLFDKILPELSSNVFLIFTGKALSPSNSLFQSVDKYGVVLHFPLEKSWEKENHLTDWIIDRMKSQGKYISKSTSHYLINWVGLDIHLLNMEIEKLICYLGDREEILEDDVRDLSVCSSSSTVWQLGDAVFQRNFSKMFTLSRSLFYRGETIFSIIPQLRRQFQVGYHICSILKNGGSSQDVQKMFPYMKGRILNRNIRQSQNYGMESFKKGMLAINRTDTLSRNSFHSMDFLLETLLMKLGSER